MKSILCVLLICYAACGVLRADWRAILQSEATSREKDEGIFFTIDRVRELEKAATPEDAPYLHLYLTLLLSEGLETFEYNYSPKVLPDETVASHLWTRLQVTHLIEKRLEQDLNFLAANPNLPWDSFPVFRKTELPRWPNQPILYLIPELPPFKNHRLIGMRDERFDQIIAIANASGDWTLEGYMTLKELEHYSEEWPDRKALIALRESKPWPDTLGVLMLAEEAKTYTADHELQQKANCLTRIVERATDYTTKVRAQLDLNELRLAAFDLSDIPRLTPPKPFKGTLRYRNMERLSVEIYKDDYDCSSAPPLTKKVFKLPPPSHPYAWMTTEIELPELPLGEYSLRWSTVGNLQSHPVVNVTSLTVSSFTVTRIRNSKKTPTPKGWTTKSGTRTPLHYGYAGLLYFADSTTYEPLANTPITIQGATFTSDANGMIPLQYLPDHNTCENVLISARGDTHSLQHGNFYEHSSSREVKKEAPETRVALVTDSPWYQAGDTMRWKVIVTHFDSEKNTFVPSPHETGCLSISSTDGALSFEETLTTDATGCLTGELPLPPETGNTHVAFTWNEERLTHPSILISASDYTPPMSQLEVTALPSSAPLPSERQFEIRGRAISGIPLAGTKVQWKLDLESTRNAEYKGEVTLDEHGRALLTHPIALPNTGVSVQNIALHVRMLQPNGKPTSRTLYTQIQPAGYSLECSLPEEHWCFENRPFNVLLTCDERSDLNGKIEVYPSNGKQQLPWIYETPDTPPSYTFPFAKMGTVPITLPAGYYTLRAKTPDVKTPLCEVCVYPLNAEPATPTFTPDEDGAVLFQWPQRKKAKTQFGCVIVNKNDPIHYQPIPAGTTLKGYAWLKGDTPTFVAIRTLNSLSEIRRIHEPFFDLSIPNDLRGTIDVVLFSLDCNTIRTVGQTIEVTPPQTLCIEATSLPTTVPVNSEQTWELTVNDPNAEIALVCYDYAVEQDFTPTRARFDFATFTSTKWSLFTHLDFYSPFMTGWTIQTSEYPPFDICDPSGYKRSFTPLFNDLPMKTERMFQFPPFSQTSYSSKLKDRLRGLSIGHYSPRNFGEPPLRDLPTVAYHPDLVAALTQGQQDSRKSLLWLPKAPLEQGKVRFTLSLPNKITSWRLVAYAFTPDGRTATFTHLFNSLPLEE